MSDCAACTPKAMCLKCWNELLGRCYAGDLKDYVREGQTATNPSKD